MAWLYSVIAFVLAGLACVLSKFEKGCRPASLGKEYLRSYIGLPELVGNLVFAALGWILYSLFGATWFFGLIFIFCFFLYTIVWSDIRRMVIPDYLIIILVILAVIRLLIGQGENLLLSLAGTAALGLSTLFVNFVNKKAIGLGDVKLLAALGLFFGLWDGLTLLVLTFIMTGLAGLFLLTFKLGSRNSVMPFAPFAGLAVVIYFAVAALSI
jgi:leader peptidase (prepilin peptidase)/N-methyltransferase